MNDSNDSDVYLVDVGNVLLHDAAVDMSFSYFLRERIRLEIPDFSCSPRALTRLASNVEALNSGLKGVVARAMDWAWQMTLSQWQALAVPIRGAFEALPLLESKRMCIVANQPKETIDVLTRHGVFERFEHVFLDSIVGLSKPDTAFLAYAMERMHTTPRHTWMVGDRVDNDLVPARSLGLRTAWIRPPRPDVTSVRCVPVEWREAYLSEPSPHSLPDGDLADVMFDSFAEFAKWANERCSAVERS